MSKAALRIKEKIEIEFLKSKTYTEINVMFNQLNSKLKQSQKEIAELKQSNTWESVEGLQTTECIHPLDKLRIIGGNISCLECKGYWKRIINE